MSTICCVKVRFHKIFTFTFCFEPMKIETEFYCEENKIVTDAVKDIVDESKSQKRSKI